MDPLSDMGGPSSSRGASSSVSHDPLLSFPYPADVGELLREPLDDIDGGEGKRPRLDGDSTLFHDAHDWETIINPDSDDTEDQDRVLLIDPLVPNKRQEAPTVLVAELHNEREIRRYRMGSVSDRMPHPHQNLTFMEYIMDHSLSGIPPAKSGLDKSALSAHAEIRLPTPHAITGSTTQHSVLPAESDRQEVDKLVDLLYCLPSKNVRGARYSSAHLTKEDLTHFGPNLASVHITLTVAQFHNFLNKVRLLPSSVSGKRQYSTNIGSCVVPVYTRPLSYTAFTITQHPDLSTCMDMSAIVDTLLPNMLCSVVTMFYISGFREEIVRQFFRRLLWRPDVGFLMAPPMQRVMNIKHVAQVLKWCQYSMCENKATHPFASTKFIYAPQIVRKQCKNASALIPMETEFFPHTQLLVENISPSTTPPWVSALHKFDSPYSDNNSGVDKPSVPIASVISHSQLPSAQASVIIAQSKSTLRLLREEFFKPDCYFHRHKTIVLIDLTNNPPAVLANGFEINGKLMLSYDAESDAPSAYAFTPLIDAATLMSVNGHLVIEHFFMYSKVKSATMTAKNLYTTTKGGSYTVIPIKRAFQYKFHDHSFPTKKIHT